MAGPTHRAVFLIPDGSSGELLENIARETAEKGSHVVVLASRPVHLPNGHSAVLPVPDLGEDLFPLAAATTQALLLEAVARRRGVTAGTFRHGSKITTRE